MNVPASQPAGTPGGGNSSLEGTADLPGARVDAWLLEAADRPVLGLNLACAWPFPEELRAAYEQWTKELSRLDAGAWLYPFAQTHVTLATLLSFARFPHPGPAQSQTVASVARRCGEAWERWRKKDEGATIRPFELHFAGLRLASAAAFLEWRNPSGEVELIRRFAADWARSDAGLWEVLLAGGFTVPRIIHSTVLRFRALPSNFGAFRAGFDRIARQTEFRPLRVSALLLTAETEPYMRAGRALHQLALDGASAA